MILQESKTRVEDDKPFQGLVHCRLRAAITNCQKPSFKQIQRVSSQVKVFTDTKDITPPVDEFLAGHIFWVLKLQAQLLTMRGCLLSSVLLCPVTVPGVF